MPFTVHLIIDFVAGVAFAAAPFLLGFEEFTTIDYWGMGGSAIVVMFVTNLNIGAA